MRAATKKKTLKVGIVVGEQSGDNLGSSLMQALKLHYPTAQFCGIGGDKMQMEGCNNFASMEKLSIMGIVEVVPKIPELYRLRNQLVKQFIAAEIDVFIGIDAPDFNLGLEEKLKAQGIKTVHYVSPSVWAWRQKRIIKIKKSTDLMLTLFPFEQAFYHENQHPAICVGHPLAESYALERGSLAARKSLGLKSDGEIVAIFPGSRVGEVSQLLPDFLAVAHVIKAENPAIQIVVSVANNKVEAMINSLLLADNTQTVLKIKCVYGKSELLMRASDVLLIASGTATFEGLLCKTPMVAAYKLNKLTYALAKRLVKTPYYTLPNILANKNLVPEHIQNYTVEELSKDVLYRLTNQSLRTQLQETFHELHKSLRLGGSKKAAQAIVDLLNKT